MPEKETTLATALLNGIAPAFVAAVGALAVAFYTQRSQQHDSEIETQRLAASASAQADQQEHQVRQAERAAQAELLRDLAPRVVGSAGSSMNCPLAVGLWESVYPGTPAPVLSSACPSATAPPRPPPSEEHWGISLGTVSTAKIACERAETALAKGFPIARVYRIRRNQQFEAIVGDYSSKSDAEPVAASVRLKLRLDSLVAWVDPERVTFYDCQPEGKSETRDGGG